MLYRMSNIIVSMGIYVKLINQLKSDIDIYSFVICRNLFPFLGNILNSRLVSFITLPLRLNEMQLL